MKIENFISQSPLASSLLSAMRMQAEITRRLPKGITFLQALVLCAIHFEKEMVNLTGIAKSLGISKSALSHLLTSLETKKMIKRKQCTGDYRRWKIELSSQALEIIPLVIGFFHKNQESLENQFSDNERTSYLDFLNFLENSTNKLSAKVEE